jgi:hypothetical protein
MKTKDLNDKTETLSGGPLEPVGSAWEKHHRCKTCRHLNTTRWWENPCNRCCVIDFLDLTKRVSFWEPNTEVSESARQPKS